MSNITIVDGTHFPSNQRRQLSNYFQLSQTGNTYQANGSSSMNDCFRLLMKDNERKHRQKEKAALEDKSLINSTLDKIINSNKLPFFLLIINLI